MVWPQGSTLPDRSNGEHTSVLTPFLPPPRASLLGSPMGGRTGGEMVEETLRTVDVQLICVHLFTSYQHDEDQVQEKREQGLQGPASPFRTRTFGRGNEAFGGVWLEVQT